MNWYQEILDDFLVTKPNVARMYDYFLGGFHNFEIDRTTAEEVLKNNPDAKFSAWANRAFLRRAVTFLTAQGIDQFLDIGSGLPTVGSVHQVAQANNPNAHVVYVDHDRAAVIFGQDILKDNPKATAIHADARRPAEILNHPEVQRHIDFSRPVAVLILALLHFITDDVEAYHSVRVLRDALVPGSYLAITHGTQEGFPPEVVEQAQKLYSRSKHPFKARLRTEIEPFFQGLDLVEPGLVYLPCWRPEDPSDILRDQPEQSGMLGAIARKQDVQR